MNQKGFANIVLIIVIVAIIAVGGYFVLSKKSVTPNTATDQQQTNNPVTPTAQDITANWKTYRNDKFGFEFKYPTELTAVSSGPSEEQKKLDRGEMISGTVPPSYDTITFSNSTNKEQLA